MLKKLKQDDIYKATIKEEKSAMEEAAVEDLEQKRFNDRILGNAC